MFLLIKLINYDRFFYKWVIGKNIFFWVGLGNVVLKDDIFRIWSKLFNLSFIELIIVFVVVYIKNSLKVVSIFLVFFLICVMLYYNSLGVGGFCLFILISGVIM